MLSTRTPLSAASGSGSALGVFWKRCTALTGNENARRIMRHRDDRDVITSPWLASLLSTGVSSEPTTMRTASKEVIATQTVVPTLHSPLCEPHITGALGPGKPSSKATGINDARNQKYSCEGSDKSRTEHCSGTQAPKETPEAIQRIWAIGYRSNNPATTPHQ